MGKECLILSLYRRQTRPAGLNYMDVWKMLHTRQGYPTYSQSFFPSMKRCLFLYAQSGRVQSSICLIGRCHWLALIPDSDLHAKFHKLNLIEQAGPQHQEEIFALMECPSPHSQNDNGDLILSRGCRKHARTTREPVRITKEIE